MSVVPVAAMPLAPDEDELMPDMADDVPPDDASPDAPHAAVAATTRAHAAGTRSKRRVRVSSLIAVARPAAEDVGGDLVGQVGAPLAVRPEHLGQRGGVDG